MILLTSIFDLIPVCCHSVTWCIVRKSKSTVLGQLLRSNHIYYVNFYCLSLERRERLTEVDPS